MPLKISWWTLLDVIMLWEKNLRIDLTTIKKIIENVGLRENLPMES